MFGGGFPIEEAHGSVGSHFPMLIGWVRLFASHASQPPRTETRESGRKDRRSGVGISIGERDNTSQISRPSPISLPHLFNLYIYPFFGGAKCMSMCLSLACAFISASACREERKSISVRLCQEYRWRRQLPVCSNEYRTRGEMGAKTSYKKTLIISCVSKFLTLPPLLGGGSWGLGVRSAQREKERDNRHPPHRPSPASRS